MSLRIKRQRAQRTRTWLIIYERSSVEQCSRDRQHWEAFFLLIWQINQCSRSYQILKCCASTKWSFRWSLLIRRNLIVAVYGWFVNSVPSVVSFMVTSIRRKVQKENLERGISHITVNCQLPSSVEFLENRLRWIFLLLYGIKLRNSDGRWTSVVKCDNVFRKETSGKLNGEKLSVSVRNVSALMWVRSSLPPWKEFVVKGDLVNRSQRFRRRRHVVKLRLYILFDFRFE